MERLSERDGGGPSDALFRLRLAILEDGGTGKMGIGLMGLGELVS